MLTLGYPGSAVKRIEVSTYVRTLNSSGFLMIFMMMRTNGGGTTVNISPSEMQSICIAEGFFNCIEPYSKKWEVLK